ncbi:TMEM165/GDT1 family protein [Rhodoferax sediminis]|uniref:GDT1 family protein n=1 Tax=Rhodoferax sediminis TaxID=2509614 RepID=A0A515D627_9BURK|nr:TMEM165/GDT1 family protein [Rhodoferax sediminis]
MASTMMPPSRMNKVSEPCFSASINPLLNEMPEIGALLTRYRRMHQSQAKIRPVCAITVQVNDAVVAGTTAGMLLADAPVVWLGGRMTRLVPIRLVHGVSAAVFAALGLFALRG